MKVDLNLRASGVQWSEYTKTAKNCRGAAGSLAVNAYVIDFNLLFGNAFTHCRTSGHAGVAAKRRRGPQATDDAKYPEFPAKKMPCLRKR